jgi:hypothetical protein
MIKRKKKMPLTTSEAARVAVVAALICTKKKVKATKPS